MIQVIGEKYRNQDMNFSRKDMNAFSRLQAQDDSVAAWSDATITKIKSVLVPDADRDRVSGRAERHHAESRFSL